MEPSEFLDVAEKLNGISGAAANRSAISRAYYSSYHQCVKFFNSIGIPVSKGPSGHQEVEGLLNNANVGKIAEKAFSVGKIKSLRLKADYNLDEKNTETPATASDAIINANDVNNYFKNTKFSSSDQEMIKQNISKWKEKIKRARLSI